MDIDTYLSDFEDAYIAAMLWSGLDGDEPLDSKCDNDDLSDALRARVHADCEKFVTDKSALLEDYPAEQAGHDFALTRNGHGTGFWDRTNPAYTSAHGREMLTRASNKMGEQSWYVGDDGQVYA